MAFAHSPNSEHKPGSLHNFIFEHEPSSEHGLIPSQLPLLGQNPIPAEHWERNCYIMKAYSRARAVTTANDETFKEKNKAGYTATNVTCVWAGAVMKRLKQVIGQEQ